MTSREHALLRPVSVLPSIGKKRADVLARLGIERLWHLLLHMPLRYEDLGHPTPIREIVPDQPCLVRGAVQKTTERRPRGRSHVRSIVTVQLWDGTGDLSLVFFNQRYLTDTFLPEREFYIHGTAELKGRRLEMVSPDWEPAVEAAEHAPVRAVYPLTEGLSQKALRGLAASALDYFDLHGDETLPGSLLSPQKLPPLGKAFRMVHDPYSFARAQHRPDDWPRYAELGRRRLAFEELFYLQLQVQRRRAAVERVRIEPYRNESLAALPWLPSAFIEGLPFSLTAAQQRAIEEIRGDLLKSLPMHRLLIGDVGSGKTVVFLYALLYAVAHEDQAALLAPTEVLAEQHFATVQRFLADLPVSVSLLTGSTSRLEREGALWDMGAGKAQLTIGTHALLENDIEWNRLGMVVIDEQHKFGVRQRARLVAKGHEPHLLVTSATPIPRTLALTLYGDLDLTVLDELPPGRRPIETRWLGDADLPRVHGEIRRHVGRGERVFVVCPLIEASDALPDLAPLVDTHAAMTAALPGISVGMLHGRMKSEEKTEIMRALVRGDVEVLVSTTVIEVGVDVPLATLMVILSAERFGLSQLHQLRGRIGRSALPSACYAISNGPMSAAGKERLSAFASTSDGFKLAEKDLEIRGPGELLGLRQSGALGFRAADLARDTTIIAAAQSAARQWLGHDFELAREESANLRQMITWFESTVPLSGA